MGCGSSNNRNPSTVATQPKPPPAAPAEEEGKIQAPQLADGTKTYVTNAPQIPNQKPQQSEPAADKPAKPELKIPVLSAKGSSENQFRSRYRPSTQEQEFPEDLDEEFCREIEQKRFNRRGVQINIFDRTLAGIKEEQKVYGNFELETAPSGDQALAVKPWIGAIRPPQNAPAFSTAEPAITCTLEYVYGYRCFDTRQNIYYSANPNEIVYMAAAVGIVLNKTSNTQRFMGTGEKRTAKGHIDDITALAINSQRTHVATGEVGKNPKIIVWTAADCQIISDFRQGRDSRAVTSLAFSNFDKFLVATAFDDDHYVRVFNWETGELKYEQKGGRDKILDCAWSIMTTEFCTVGIKHVCFWSKQAGFSKKNGIFGRNPATNLTTVQALKSGAYVTGGANGMLYLWNGNSVAKAAQVHSQGSSVHTLRAVDASVLSGGSDNVINMVDSNLQIVKTWQFESIPRAVDICETSIVVGLRDGTIVECAKDATTKTVLMESHSDGETWGLATQTARQGTLILTSGDDNKVKVWNAGDRRCLETATLEEQPGPKRKAGEGASTLAHNSPNQQARCVAISPTTGNVAIGHNDGHITIRKSITELTNVLHTKSEPTEWVEVMRFSPDGKWLAVGSHDNTIYIYNTTSYALTGKRGKHHSFITALDWSLDSTALHSTSGDYELLFWSVDASSGRINHLPSGATAFCNEQWATWSTHFGWPVQGIYGGIIDYTHVNRVDRDPNKSFFAIGNDNGEVEIFNNPNNEQSKSRAFVAHSEHVTNVKWSEDGQWLFSTGGYDQCLMQWKVQLG